MNLNELSTKISMDLKGAMDRFCGQEALYTKYLKKIVADTTFDNFKQALNNIDNDLKQVEFTAHTLKGMFGNLGLTELYENYSKIVSDIRTNEGKNVNALAKIAIENTENNFAFIKQLN